MLYGILLSFRLQIYLLNSVACLYLSFLKEQTWFLYLNLKVVSQRPMYVSLVCLSCIVSLVCLSNVGKCFLSLIDQHFPNSHSLHKIFNRNTLKLSYSCMTNIKTIISNHNKAQIKKSDPTNDSNCNCRNSSMCPMDGKCNDQNIYIYIYNNIMNWRFHQLLKCSIGKLEQCRFVELDYLVEDIYCYSEFHAPPGAIIRQLPKLTDTKDDVQNLKIQNNAY